MRLKSRGFTLPELIVATVIAGIAAGVMIATLSRQQRFFSSAESILDVRGQLRDAADVLAGDIRGAAVGNLGMPVMMDSAVEMFAVIATSVACTTPTLTSVGLPPQSLARGNTLTSLLAVPDTGDIAMIYLLPLDTTGSARWETARITSFASRALSSSCPPGSGFTSSADATSGSPGYFVVLDLPAGVATRKGSPIVFARRVRYSLYRSSDGLWYLGYRRCSGAVAGCASVQPVSGPYRPYSAAPGSSGLSFRYYDESGATVSSSSRSVARVDIVIRGQTARAASFAGDARLAYQDSVIVTVSPRNRE